MNFKSLRPWRGLPQTKPIISDLNILTDGTTLRANLFLGSFAVKTEATAHPGGERSLSHAGPCPPRAGTAASAHRRASARHRTRGARTAPRRSPPASRDVWARAPGTPPRARGAPRPLRPAPRRGRSPVPPGGQQGLAQVGTQLPQRRLRVRHLQRPGPLLKPHPQLHGDGGGGGRAQGPGPGGETLTAAPERQLPELEGC